MSKITFWFEFASTYSYLSAMRVEELCRDAGVELEWRPFLLGPIFGAQGWTTSPFNLFEAKGRNMWRDMERRAAARGLPPITRPDPFPMNGLLAARVATLGAGEDWAPAFIRSVYNAEFAKGRNISNPATIEDQLNSLDLDGAALIAQAGGDEVKAALRRATDEAILAEIYGAPSFTVGGELFWGDDRLEDAIAWAHSAG